MNMMNLMKLNLKQLLEVKQNETNTANLQLIEKRMETIRERYKKKNIKKKETSSAEGSKSPTSVKSDNSNSQIWTAPDPEQCRQTTFATATSLLKNYHKEQNTKKKKVVKRDDPTETTINHMISRHLDNATPFPFKFLENYNISSITFQVSLK